LIDRNTSPHNAIMASRTAPNQYLSEKPNTAARSPAPNGRNQQAKLKPKSYTSEGVKDHDIFNLPGSDWRLLGLLVVVAAVVRLFRIAQPSSVVFDEVQ
jgi:dolichyl-phosphate-mannose-protein mannosyltransferase